MGEESELCSLRSRRWRDLVVCFFEFELQLVPKEEGNV